MRKGKTVASLKPSIQEGVTEDPCLYSFVEGGGTTGDEWIKFFAKEGIPVEPSAMSVLRSPNFKSISRVKSVIAIFNLSSLKNLTGMPEFENLAVPTPEIACLLCKKLKGPDFRAMRIETLAVMHQPIIGLGNLPRVLVICCNDKGQIRLSSLSVKEGGKLHGVDGYAYVKKGKKL